MTNILDIDTVITNYKNLQLKYEKLKPEISALEEEARSVVKSLINTLHSIKYCDPDDPDEIKVNPLCIEIFCNGLSGTNWGSLDIGNENAIFSIDTDGETYWTLNVEDRDGIDFELALVDLELVDLIYLSERLNDILDEFEGEEWEN